MLCALGYLYLHSLVFVLCVTKDETPPPPPLQCLTSKCDHSGDPCIITNTDNHLHGHCKHRHDQITEKECEQTLRNHESCVCYTQDCIDQVHVEYVHNGNLCGGLACHTNEGCLHTQQNGVLHSQCKSLKELQSIDPHVHHGFTGTLPLYCLHSDCNQEVYDHFLSHLTQVTSSTQPSISSRAPTIPIVLKCGNQTCLHDEGCYHKQLNDGALLSQCISLSELQKNNVHSGCYNHLPCYCKTTRCNQGAYNQVHKQQTTVHPHLGFQCGNIKCTSYQVCVLRENESQHLHFSCSDNKTANALHCLPTLLTNHSTCYCETRACVDHTVVSIMQGLHLTGVICNDTDLTVCPPQQVCEIIHHSNGLFSRHCGDGKNTHECIRAPAVGERCHCSSQQCVYGSLSVFDKPTTLPSTLDHITTHQLIHLTTPLLSSTTTGGLEHTTFKEMTTPQVSAAPSTIVSQTTLCNDVEDLHFSCSLYHQAYGLCTAETGTLFTIANRRCKNYCGICNGTGPTNATFPGQSTTPSQPVCVDHDNRCGQLKEQICSSVVSQQYIIATCPFTCDKCNEYFASFTEQKTPTVAPERTNTATERIPTAPPAKCHTCGDIDNLIPCFNKDAFNNNNSSSIVCPAGHTFCMTDVYQDIHGNIDIYKRCVTGEVCNRKWIEESADLDYCSRYGTVENPSAYECHFCCQGDHCNTEIQPPVATLVAKSRSK